MEKFLLVDGNSLLNRAFYALPVLSTASGEYTNAVYGFFNMLFNMMDRLEPEYAAVAFDRKEPTFRHKEYLEYKAGRKPMPDELIPQFPLLKSALEEANIPFIEMPGFEADDLLGTLSLMGENSGLECCVLSGDKDVLQLVSEHTTVYLTKKGISELETYTPEFLAEKMGLEPNQIVELKALMGDNSDNIPGIPGIGEKTALKLLGEYKNVDNLLAHADEIKGKLGEKIAAGRESALLSRRLALIDRRVPIEGGTEQFRYKKADVEILRALFTRLEFKSLLKKLPAPEIGPETRSHQRLGRRLAGAVAQGRKGRIHNIHARLYGLKQSHISRARSVMSVQMYGHAHLLLNPLYHLISFIGQQQIGHILYADCIRAHLFHFPGQLHKIILRMHGAGGVAYSAFGDSAVFFAGFNRLLQIAQIVQRVKNPYDIYAVLYGFLYKHIHYVVRVMLISQNVLPSEKHLQLGVGHGLFKRAQALPRILVQKTQTGVKGGASPAFQGIIAHAVQHWSNGQHFVQAHARSRLGLMRVPQYSIGN